MNIFIKHPEFIQMDPRAQRPQHTGYAVTPEFMLLRHQAMLPSKMIEGKRIVDLGSCLSATGAWCLSNGAAFYQGVEIQSDFVRDARYCLEKYYPSNKWSIAESTIEDFLSNSNEQYDVLIASGVIYGTSDAPALLELFSKRADCIVIESKQSQTVFHSKILSDETKKALARDPRINEFLENESFIAVGHRGMVSSEKKTFMFPAFNPSMGAIQFMMKALGYKCDVTPYLKLKATLPKEYSALKRYALHFKKNHQIKTHGYGFKNVITDPTNITAKIDWA